MKISAVMITFNEEINLERCLKSLSFLDEIVIFDGKSTDATREIAEKYNCSVYTREKWEGYGKAKHRAVELARNDWVLSIDADEELSPQLIEKIKIIAKNGESDKAFRIKRKTFFLGKLINYCGWQNDKPLRLFNRKIGQFNDEIVHETIETKAEIATITEPILHYSFPDLDTYMQKSLKYAVLGAEKAYKKGRKAGILKALLAGWIKFFKMYFVKLGILDGKAGLKLSLVTAFINFYKYMQINELHRKNA